MSHFYRIFGGKCKSNPWLFHHASRCYLTPKSRADRAGQSFSVVAGCSYSYSRQANWTAAQYPASTTYPNKLICRTFYYSISKRLILKTKIWRCLEK